MPIFRSDLQKLARIRLREARKLLVHGEYSGAYHLAGVAVECALKACIARRTKQHEFPDKNHAEQAWKHDLEKLAKLAGLDPRSLPMAIAINWTIVKDWTIDSRYEVIDDKKAKSLYSALVSRRSGVMQWIRTHW